MADLQSGSCEPCKRKKCKCDRQLPVCGHCTTSQTECKYAESNKRGIPAGYLGALEARLNETEAALYNALCELRRFNGGGSFSYTNVIQPLSSHQNNTSKALRMKSWIQCPLQTSNDVENWWISFQENQTSYERDDTRPEPKTKDDSATHWHSHLNSQAQNSFTARATSRPTLESPGNMLYDVSNQSLEPCLQQSHTPPQLPDSNQPKVLSAATSGQFGFFDIQRLATRDESIGGSTSRPHEEASSQQIRGDSQHLTRSQQLSAEMSHIYY
ncbi:uncharacterized protein LY89DRAFT_56716 [Mollisia scopiformis]|uniref:Zn(2)-C6 fungal-type domain-containing protein n=1 Tax=Mollisia scopiformis TaxID=149040 RepID=A0A194XBL3_MOLSC|nr:uncharacterized protein LY89DRAFT_56716 [Mollisia scopiformis]KUJ17555.1 hypothetical protein LY89DRAFT_56716 [Mollisia scopiformis]